MFLGDVYLPHPVHVDAALGEHLVYNLEAPLTREERGWPGTVNLRCPEDHTVATFGRRPLAVCLANNHIMDFGATGLAETMQRLQEAGTLFFGAGTLGDNCHNPLLLPLDGETVALAGYVCPTANPVFATAAHPGVAPIELERIRRDVETARARGATRVVICLHWGIEEAELPRPSDVEVARAIAELGVDLVVGHHAHCIQPSEVHGRTPIFYGIGNAIFPDVDSPCAYGSDGVPRDRFRKLQNYWNRPSLAVAYTPSTGAVSVARLHCDGRVLHVTQPDGPAPALSYGDPAAYQRRFARHVFYATWRHKLVNYARRPKLPRLRHLKSLAGILREARGHA